MLSQNPYIKLFKIFWKYSPNKKIVIFFITFTIISKVISLIWPYILGLILNYIQIEGAESWGKIQKLLLLFFILQIISWIFHWTSRIFENINRFKIEENYKKDMFHKVSSLPTQRHTDNHSGKTISRIEKAWGSINDFAGSQFMYFDTIVFSIWSLFSLTLIWWKGAVIVLILSLIAFFIVQKYDKQLILLVKEMNEKRHIVSSTLYDFISNIRTVITLRFENRALKTLATKLQDQFPPYQKHNILNEQKWFFMDIILKFAVVITIFMYIYEQFSLQNTVLIWTISMIIQYIQKMQNAMSSFTWQYSGLVRSAADIETLSPILDTYDNLPITYKLKAIKKWHNIKIDKLNFTYEDLEHHKHTLKNIDILLQPGKNIAIVWESGSGKSTFLSLLRWLYDVNNVSTNVDWVYYDHLHILAHNTSLIPQEPEIFEQTILFNLTIGLYFPKKKIQEYLKLARFDDVAKRLVNWLNTDIKEKWVNLSGGQKQRLALARGLLLSESSDILLLDEPTSSVDPINEQLIYEGILSKYKNKCIVSAMHRLHLLYLFDEVIVLDKGVLVERWTLSELIANNWKFKKMRTKYQKSNKDISSDEL